MLKETLKGKTNVEKLTMAQVAMQSGDPETAADIYMAMGVEVPVAIRKALAAKLEEKLPPPWRAEVQQYGRRLRIIVSKTDHGPLTDQGRESGSSQVGGGPVLGG